MSKQEKCSENQPEESKTANIMVAGKSGTGKSTLINALFGEELAVTGVGPSITQHINEYENENIPIHIWDTVGLELNSEKTRRAIDEIKRTIASKSETKDTLDQIHAIWYCVNANSNRYEGEELKFIKELYSIGVPFTIVLTQCYGSKKKIAEFEKIINDINYEMGLKNITIIKVLAQEFEIEIEDQEIPTIKKPPFGLDDLVNHTIDQLPIYVKSGFIAAQKVSESLKHIECERLIWTYVDRIRNNYWSKSQIINWDNVPLINIITTDAHIKELFKDISKIYNTEIPENGLDNIMKELGGLSPENALQGLLNPVSKKFNANVGELYKKNARGEFNENFEMLPKNKRVARMIVLYGYTFLESIEIFWKTLREKEIDELEKKIEILVEIIREKCKEFNGKTHHNHRDMRGEIK